MTDLRVDVADYEEFDALHSHAAWAGLPWREAPAVRRCSLEVNPDQRVSMLQWGDGESEVVFLHGGAQNAHTWDTVAMALDRPLIAIDLPGHGHSDWREDRDYGLATTADAVATVIAAAAPSAAAVVGMSLGGLIAIRLAADRPDLVRRLVVVDVTPGVVRRVTDMTPEQREAVALINGPSVYETFDDMVAAAAATMPDRPLDSVRPGVRHNAKQLDDGRWTWRYDHFRRREDASPPPPNFDLLWNDVASIDRPLMLVRGGRSAHVHDDDIAELRRRAPHARVESVHDAGHSVQSNRPVELARLLEDFVSER